MSILLFSILVGFEVKPAQAQWTVFDPSQYVLQLSKKIEEATRWMETVNQYITMYETAVKQYQKMVESVTNLRGILDKVDEQITRHKQLITTYAQLGKLIRGTYELKSDVSKTRLRVRFNQSSISHAACETEFSIWIKISAI